MEKCSKCGQNLSNSKSESDKRGVISFYLFVGFILLLALPFLFQCSRIITFYESVFGRILFCFDFFILGLSWRAFAYHRSTKRGIKYIENNPWKSYLFEYIPIGIVISIFIFSIVTATFESIYSTHIFYLLSGSISAVAGYKGYGFLDKMKVG